MIAHRMRRGRKKARGSVAQLAARIVALSTYFLDADMEKLKAASRVAALSVHGDCDQDIVPGEKVLDFGSVNFEGSTLREWQIDMIAIAAQAPRSADPIEHIVLSFQSGEEPQGEQRKEAVDLFLRVLGASECQAIWSQHGNTDNSHIHLLLNRIDPATGSAVQLGKGWDIEAMHMAVAVIEARQGWRAEPNALFTCDQNDVIVRKTGLAVRTLEDFGISLPPAPASKPDPIVRAASVEAAKPFRSHNRLDSLDHQSTTPTGKAFRSHNRLDDQPSGLDSSPVGYERQLRADVPNNTIEKTAGPNTPVLPPPLPDLASDEEQERVRRAEFLARSKERGR